MGIFRKTAAADLVPARIAQTKAALKQTTKAPTVAEQRVINQADKNQPGGGHISHQHLN